MFSVMCVFEVFADRVSFEASENTVNMKSSLKLIAERTEAVVFYGKTFRLCL